MKLEETIFSDYVKNFANIIAVYLFTIFSEVRFRKDIYSQKVFTKLRYFKHIIIFVHKPVPFKEIRPFIKIVVFIKFLIFLVIYKIRK